MGVGVGMCVCVHTHVCLLCFFVALDHGLIKLSKVREVEYLNGKPPRKTQVLQEMVMVTQLLASFPLNLD